MAIIQTNIFICEKCERMASISSDVSAYSDPIVTLPDDWELGTDDEGKLYCPSCRQGQGA